MKIGNSFDRGQTIAAIGGELITAPFTGVLRGLLHPGLNAMKGMKIGDIDPRNDPGLCHLVSDKSLAVGGATLEALLDVSRGSDETMGLTLAGALRRSPDACLAFVGAGGQNNSHFPVGPRNGLTGHRYGYNPSG